MVYGPYDNTKWDLCHRASQIQHTIPAEKQTLKDRVARVLRYFSARAAEPMHFQVHINSGRGFSCAPGQLTDLGRANLFRLGTWFKKQYSDREKLISPSFVQEEFFLRSTNFQRTLESLQSLMQGMFRSHTGKIYVGVQDITSDTLGCNRYCPKLSGMKSASHKEIKEKFESKAKKISEYFSKNYSQHFGGISPYALYDLVASSRAHGFSRFRHVSPGIMRDLEKYSIQLWFNHLHNPVGLSLYTGALLKEIADKMLHKAESPHLREKVSIFSAHDVTIYPILMSMGQHPNKWPKFGSNIIFELLVDRRTRDRYVQMRYNKEVMEIPKCKYTVNNGRKYCPLSEFVRICNESYMKDSSEVCLQEN